MTRSPDNYIYHNPLDFKHLLFDFDGTLADTSYGIHKAFVSACKLTGLAAPDYLNFRSTIGPPITGLSQRFFPNIDQYLRREFVETFRQQYDTNYYRDCRWYEGVENSLKYFHQKGVLLGVVTNKPTQPTRDLLESAGFSEYFTIVVGIDAIGKDSLFRSKSDALTWTLQQLEIDHRGDSLYVGDTISDEEACSLVGLPFIAVGYGFYEWAPEDVARLNRTNTDQIFDPWITQPLSTLKQLSDTLLIEQNIEDT